MPIWQPASFVTDWPLSDMPRHWRRSGNTPNVTANAIADNSGEAVAFIFQIPRTGNIERIGIMVGTGASVTLTVTLETVDLTTGAPSGTLKDAVGDTSTGTIASPVSAGWNWTTLAGLCAVTKGDLVAIRVVSNGSSAITVNSFTYVSAQLPYCNIQAGGTWTKDATALPIFALEYDDGSYAEMVDVIVATNANGAGFTKALTSSATPDEVGLAFQVERPTRCTGGFIWADFNAGSTIEVRLYNAGPSASATPTHLETVTPDSEAVAANTARAPLNIRFVTTHLLVPNVWYYFTVRATGATATDVYYLTVPAAAVMACLPGGVNFQYVEAVDGASFTKTDTQRPFMGILYDGVG